MKPTVGTKSNSLLYRLPHQSPTLAILAPSTFHFVLHERGGLIWWRNHGKAGRSSSGSGSGSATSSPMGTGRLGAGFSNRGGSSGCEDQKNFCWGGARLLQAACGSLIARFYGFYVTS